MVSKFVVIASCEFTSNFRKEDIVTMHLSLSKLPSGYCQVTSLSSWVLCKIQHHHYVQGTPASKPRPAKSISEPPHITSSINSGDALDTRTGRVMPFLATLWSRSPPWGFGQSYQSHQYNVLQFQFTGILLWRLQLSFPAYFPLLALPGLQILSLESPIFLESTPGMLCELGETKSLFQSI